MFREQHSLLHLLHFRKATFATIFGTLCSRWLYHLSPGQHQDVTDQSLTPQRGTVKDVFAILRGDQDKLLPCHSVAIDWAGLEGGHDCFYLDCYKRCHSQLFYLMVWWLQGFKIFPCISSYLYGLISHCVSFLVARVQIFRQIWTNCWTSHFQRPWRADSM